MPSKLRAERIATIMEMIVSFTFSHGDRWQEWIEAEYPLITCQDKISDHFLLEAENFISNTYERMSGNDF